MITMIRIIDYDYFRVIIVFGLQQFIKVTIAPGRHLFPFRTEKLSLVAPMVLCRNTGE